MPDNVNSFAKRVADALASEKTKEKARDFAARFTAYGKELDAKLKPVVGGAQDKVRDTGQNVVHSAVTTMGHLPVIGPRIQDARIEWMNDELARREEAEAKRISETPVEGGELDDPGNVEVRKAIQALKSHR